MILTRKQEEGLKLAVDRYKYKEKYTVISGFAGSGKSTLIKFIIEAFELDEKDVIYTAYSGKAVQVLKRKGNKNACTLHRLLFKSYLMSNGKYSKRPVDEIPYKVVVVDEISMAPKSMMGMLFSYPVHVICLGDPEQLQPISTGKMDENNHLLDHPHIFLDEVMRQAQESEIIRLTMDIRAGKPFQKTKGKDIIILDKKDLNTGMLIWADQILCATNRTRIALNRQMRELNGLGGPPRDGDKIIFTDNYWEILSEKEGEPITNGTIGYLKNTFDTWFQYPRYLHEKETVSILNSTIELPEGDCFKSIDLDKNMISSGERTVDRKDLYKIMRNKKYKNLIPIEATYGYAITCHKAQGSEFGKVLVIEENFPFVKEEHRRWLYTATTRAEEKLVLVTAN